MLFRSLFRVTVKLQHFPPNHETQLSPGTMTKAKAKTPVNEEFETACSLWRMEFAFHTFQAVRAGIEHFFERKLHSQEPEYYPMTVGLI